MTRSSMADRPLFFSGGANSASSAARSSSSDLLIAPLRLVAHESCGAFSEMLFPRVLRSHRRHPASLALELDCTPGDDLGFFRRDGGALGRDGRCYLLQT